MSIYPLDSALWLIRQHNILKDSTVFWNGPAGYFENPNFANGSIEIAKKIIEKNIANDLKLDNINLVRLKTVGVLSLVILAEELTQ